MRALFPELRTFATSADPPGVSLTASSSPRSPSSEGNPLNEALTAPVVAAPILATANSSAGDHHEEELLRFPAAEGQLNAAPLDSHPPLVGAVAHVGQYS